jgi:hypothetical protein
MPRLHAVWNRDDQTQELTKLTVFESNVFTRAPRELRLERKGDLMAVTIHDQDSMILIVLLDKEGFEALCERAEEFRRQWSTDGQEVPT